MSLPYCKKHNISWATGIACPDCLLSTSAEECLKLRAALKVAVGALKTVVGYEPFRKSLEPRKCSEALTKIEEILKNDG